MRRVTRRASLPFSIILLLILSTLLYRSRFLISLLFETGSRDRIYPSTLLSPFSDLTQDEIQNQNSTQLIPKIIHQTYKTEDIPSHWLAGQQAVKDLHPGWEYMFWTDASALSFIQTRYPTHLALYKSYPHPIQRSDALRYFILHHYGGIYLDLDLTPYRPLTSLLSLPAFACVTSPTGISNDALGSVPGHPFFALAIEKLDEYKKRWWIGKWLGGKAGYLGVMYSTGPLFLSVVWVAFLGMGGGGKEERLRVLVQEKGVAEYGFFRNVRGGSWHREDAKMIFWMGRHWAMLTVMGVVGGVAFVVTAWWGCRFLVRRWNERGRRRGFIYKELFEA